MATRLNPRTDTPNKKSQVTKDFMLGYVRYKGTPEDKDWFKEIVHKYTVEKPKDEAGAAAVEDGEEETTTTSAEKEIKLKEIRTEFCARFFPQLNNPTQADLWLIEVDSL